MATIFLPVEGGQLVEFKTSAPKSFPTGNRKFNRIAYSAAHIVAREEDGAIDWDRTVAYRSYLWSLGLGVAEAMDTSQRGMGLDWQSAKDLISSTLDAAKSHEGALVASGVGTDHLPDSEDASIDDIIAAYEAQAEFVENRGGRLILMASRALARVAKTPADYGKVYDRILRGSRAPIILHWLGEMFDPALQGYWGVGDHEAAMNIALEIIARNASKVDGIKISLLDKDKEIAMRRRLPPGVRMYTGDDFNYPELIAGGKSESGAEEYSDALLGIFDAIAPATSAALERLNENDVAGFHNILDPTVPLSRLIFEAPTRFYKTGIVFMAFLNGHQDHFRMVGDQQTARSVLHLSNIFRLADAAGILRDPEDAACRMRKYLSTMAHA